MPAHDSQYPGENKPRTIRVDGTGISMNWRNFIGAVLTLLLTGGGYAGIKLVTCEQMDEAIRTSEARQGEALQGVRSMVVNQGEQLVGLTAVVGQVQDTQHMDIAVREARRVVDEEIVCRRGDDVCVENKEREKERLRRLNMRRLAMPKENGGPLDPCASTKCQ
jgi:hypothetical protein